MLVNLLALVALALPARAEDDAPDSVELIVPAPRPWSVRVELLRLERGRWSWPGSELLRSGEQAPARVTLPPLRSQSPPAWRPAQGQNTRPVNAAPATHIQIPSGTTQG